MAHKAPYRIDPTVLPSVDEVLNDQRATVLAAEFGRSRVVSMVRSLIAERRSRLLAGREEATDRATLVEHLVRELAETVGEQQLREVRRVINAAGVVIHTNLGRAPLSDESVGALQEAAHYSTIEYDLSTGSRGRRGVGVVDLLTLLTGAEDALAVNNCAAAAMLVLSSLAAGREVIVSRGELVEIGGDFRIPDILARSGAVLREVGTTNRTHLRDYEGAICEQTAMILKVHPSNYRIIGFTKAPDTEDLVGLARERGLIFYEDAGSGALVDLSRAGITDEPVIPTTIAAGADVVSFSGDKLMGGPQAGLIVGRRDLIDRLRRDPLYRALRLDKAITAALEATLEHYAQGDPEQKIPVLRMLLATSDEVRARAERFLARLEKGGGHAGLEAKLLAGNSAVGGGAGPDARLPTMLIAITHERLSAADVQQRFREAPIPIITRIENDQVLLDLRTVATSEEADILAALTNLT